ncbi:Srl [Anthophora plagiata]
MTGSRLRPAYFVGLFLALLVVALQGVQSEEELEVPPEDLCRPYIEKALKDLGTGSLEQTSAEAGTDADKESQEDGKPASEEDGEPATDVSKEDLETEEDKQESLEGEGAESVEQAEDETDKASAEAEQGDVPAGEQSAEAGESEGDETEQPEEKSGEADQGTEEDKGESVEQTDEGAAASDQDEGTEEEKDEKSGEEERQIDEGKSEEEVQADAEKSEEETQEQAEKSDEEDQKDAGKSDEEAQADDGKSDEAQAEGESAEEAKLDEEKSDEEAKTDEVKSDEEKAEDEAADSKAEEETEEATEAASKEEKEEGAEKDEDSKAEEEGQSQEQQASGEEVKEESTEGQAESSEGQVEEEEEAKESEETEKGKSDEEAAKSAEEDKEEAEKSGEKEAEEEKEGEEEGKSVEEEKSGEEEAEKPKSRARREVDGEEDGEGSEEPEQSEEEEPTPEEDLIQEIEVPENLRSRDHVNQLLKLDEENEEKERAIQKAADIVLKELKRVYDNAIQPLESLYKYRDLSNRHFGDPEIFSKPLVLFMGPWSGGKSSIINYLLDIEYRQTSLRTGAEPSPAYFNIIMHGEEEEILDGTQLAADWTFSGLQKFGQGLLDRLRGLRLDNKLLEKVNIVEIPGILEIRKQVQRLFPFNDACQWFIDRADIIFLVYDPSKLDVGPETEAILDQLKGREHQTRIILNKADQVKPEELMRVQGALIWNISPLMSSAEPPVMYSTSLWSLPYEAGAPTRLLYAQERAFLRDLRTAIDKRVEHKIASARRFAVRVRNHAKMVDCYLTTYYNHKSFFANKKDISDKIIENPQDYHIYEGLSTLKNISRYDLPDPDVYRDFFRLNPLYDFPLLSSTCTYFRGCPINRLDVAIAYDLPELVGRYKKSVEQVIHEYETSPPS